MYTAHSCRGKGRVRSTLTLARGGANRLDQSAPCSCGGGEPNRYRSLLAPPGTLNTLPNTWQLCTIYFLIFLNLHAGDFRVKDSCLHFHWLAGWFFFSLSPPPPPTVHVGGARRHDAKIMPRPCSGDRRRSPAAGRDRPGCVSSFPQLDAQPPEEGKKSFFKLSRAFFF